MKRWFDLGLFTCTTWSEKSSTLDEVKIHLLQRTRQQWVAPQRKYSEPFWLQCEIGVLCLGCKPVIYTSANAKELPYGLTKTYISQNFSGLSGPYVNLIREYLNKCLKAVARFSRNIHQSPLWISSFNEPKPTTAQRCRSATENFILEDLLSSVLSRFKKFQPSGNLKFNILGIFQNFKLRNLMRKIRRIFFQLKSHSKYFGLLWVNFPC